MSETTLAITKEQKEVIASFKNNEILQEAIQKSEMSIEDRQDADNSVIIKDILKKARIEMEKTRKELVAPYNNIVSKINAEFKEIIWEVSAAEKTINNNQISYNNKVEEEKRKQQEEMDKLAKENDWEEEADVEKANISQEANRQKVVSWINYNKKIVKVDWELLPKQYRNIKDMEITPRVKEIKSALSVWLEVPWVHFED